MKLTKSGLLNLVLTIAVVGATALFWSQLPDRVPVAFDSQGGATQLRAKMMIGLSLPVTMVFVFFGWRVFRRLSPRGFEIDTDQRAASAAESFFALYAAVMHAVLLGNGLGLHLPFQRIALIGSGVVWAFYGNYIGKLTRNFYLGIRTPWTIVNEEVWARTHRLSAWLAVASGIVSAILPLFVTATWLFAIPLVAAVGVPSVYSYFIYERLERSTPSAPSTAASSNNEASL